MVSDLFFSITRRWTRFEVLSLYDLLKNQNLQVLILLNTVLFLTTKSSFLDPCNDSWAQLYLSQPPSVIGTIFSFGIQGSPLHLSLMQAGAMVRVRAAPSSPSASSGPKAL